MFVFHAVMVVDCAGPKETVDLGLFASWAAALDVVEAGLIEEGEDAAAFVAPDITVDKEGMVSQACWDVGNGTAFYIARREVK